MSAQKEKNRRLYKLGGTEWKKVKKKVQSSVEDIADDLIKLYAEREAAKGYAFSPDGDMQREFETSFPYQETEDQLRSIVEIKKDMERERPMDRFFVVMLAMEKQKWPSVLLLKRLWMENKWHS